MGSRRRVQGIIIDELKRIIKQYPSPRKTGIVFADELPDEPEDDGVPDYPVNVFVSREGYLKKITPQIPAHVLRAEVQGGRRPGGQFEGTNRGEILVFTDKQQVYKAKLADFEDTKASQLGTYLAQQAGHGRRRERSRPCYTPGTTAASCCCALKTARSREYP